MSVTVATIAARLDAVRERTRALYAPLASADLTRTPDPIMSPPIWDLGHIAAYEELWLVCTLRGAPSRHPELQAAYDAFETPRAARTGITLLDEAGCERYLNDVRNDALEVLSSADLDPDGPLLTREGFVFDMVAQHEAQHTETVLQSLQMFADGTYAPHRPALNAPTAPPGPGDPVAVPAGEFTMGAGPRGFAYDCERSAHRVRHGAFLIDRYPVTNARHLAFIEAGGYDRPELWSADGWEWRVRHAVEAPEYWTQSGGGWHVRSFDRLAPLEPDHPVCHVSWYEADAHARWAGARLPTEVEWERAATADPDASEPCRYPWGNELAPGASNVDQLRFGTAPIGSFPAGDAPSGCAQMIGDVWEWTSSAFTAYPGYRAFPYREYSEVFFGDRFRVLRGGSWATQPIAARTTFRNWDLPQRRQIFSGFRLAWEA